MRRFGLSRRIQALWIAAAAGGSVACGQIEVPLDLALVGDSAITIDVPFFQPPYNLLTTNVTGGVETTVVIDLNPFQLITPEGLAAVVRVDDILIAGTEILIGGGLPTGTICVVPDDEVASGGMALIQPFRSQIAFQLTLATGIELTDPTLENLLGAPIDLPFAAEVDTEIPITLADAFGLLFGLLFGGGGLGGLELSQSITTTLPPTTPILGPAEVTADLTLASVDQIPADPLLVDCVEFLSGP